jgi:hypothetical protein
MATATQDQWMEIAAAIRAQIAKAAALMPAMVPSETIQAIVGAANDAMWLEVKSASFDEAVEEHRRSLERSAIYGG